MNKEQLEHYKMLFGWLSVGAMTASVIFLFISLYFQYKEFK